jgi:hypothetical protein
MKPLPFYYWLWLLLLSTVGQSQTFCDTIFTHDGQIILANQIQSSPQGINYVKCGEAVNKRLFLERKFLKDIRLNIFNPKLQSKSINSTGFYDKPIRMRQDKPEKPFHVLLWAGKMFIPVSSRSTKGGFLLGTEFRPKKAPSLGLAFYLSPFFRESNYDDYRRKGVSGEVGMGIKKFTRARISGHRSNGFFGADIRLARHVFDYAGGNSSNLSRETVHEKWATIMANLGFQFTLKWFALEIACPIGGLYYSAKINSTNYSEYGAIGFIRPYIMVGLNL